MRKLCLFITLFFPFFTIHAQQHGLDPTFGNNGMVVTLPPNTSAGGWQDTWLQPDGKILAAGYVPTWRIAVARYKLDGKIDSTFAQNGIFTDTNLLACKGAVLTDSSILVAGSPAIGNTFCILKFKSNGTLDSSFGVYGKASQFAGDRGASGMAIQPNGRIIVCGTSGVNYAMVRFLANGTPDSSFGINGRVITYGGTFSVQCNAIALQQDGKILLTGRGWYNGDVAFMTIRYKTNGAIDSSFGTYGQVYWQPGTAAAHDIKMLPNGKILLSGGTTYPIAAEVVMRLNTDGSLDTSFNHTGYRLISYSGYTPVIFGNFGCHMQLLTDGRIVLAGTVEDTTVDYWKHASLSRCTADGQIDNSFCINGSQVLTIGQLGSGINGIVLQADGKIVAAGFTDNYSKPIVARFMPDGNVGIPEIAQASQPEINIYPNPANTSITIETNKPILSVRLTGIDGKTYKFIDKPTHTHTQFTTEDLPNGTYFVLITIHGYASLAKAITIIH